MIIKMSLQTITQTPGQAVLPAGSNQNSIHTHTHTHKKIYNNSIGQLERVFCRFIPVKHSLGHRVELSFSDETQTLKKKFSSHPYTHAGTHTHGRNVWNIGEA